MRKRITIVLFVLLAMTMSLFVGCSNKGEVVFSGIAEEYTLKTSDETFDFLKGVSAERDGKALTVNADVSAIRFGEKGEYKVTFTADEQTAEAKVKIYGTPTYTAENVTIGYGEDPCKGIVCKDSFDTALTVAPSDFERDERGRILYKTHEITYTAQDVAGNTVQFKRNVTVTDTALTTVRDKTVDLSDVSVSWIVGENTEVVSVRKIEDGNAIEVDKANYTFVAGVGRFAFRPEYIASLALGEAHSFDLTFGTGYKTVKITVTDAAAPKYTVDGDVDGGEFCEGEVALPAAVKDGASYQKIDVAYYLNDEPITELNPTLAKGDYTFKIEYKRGGSEIEGTAVTMNFAVLTAGEYYGRKISGEKFLPLWNVMISCNNRPASANNRVEIATVDEKEVFDMTNDLVGHDDDCRGFYLDMKYLDGIRKAGFTHLAITFKMKLDAGGRNNFFIDYYETDPQKYYDGIHRWRGGNGEYWGKAAEMSDKWTTATIPMNGSDTSQLFFLTESQGFYVESITPVMRAAYVDEVKDTDAFGMEIAVQCGGDTLPNVKLFYNAQSNFAEAALAANYISVGNGIRVDGCGDITPEFTLYKDENEWGKVDPADPKHFTLPRLTDPGRGVHNPQSGKAYIRWQIVNGESSATLEIYYFFAKGNDGHADHSGTYEKVLSIGNLPLMENGFAGFLVNDSEERNVNLTEFLTFNGVKYVDEITAQGAVVDFNTQCALGDQYFSIRLFYNANGTSFKEIKEAPSVYFANGVGTNGNAVKVENISGTAAFEDPMNWGSEADGANNYNFLAFRDAHTKELHDGNSGRVHVRMAIYNEGGKATLCVYFDNRTNTTLGKGKQILGLKITGLDAVTNGYIGLMIDDSVFGSHWFGRNIWFTEGFSVSPYTSAYTQNVAEGKDKIAMTFDAQCGESIRDIRMFYNSSADTVAGATASAGVLFSGDTVSVTSTGDVTFADANEWGSASDTSKRYNLLHIQKAHEKAYHDPNNGLVSVKIEIENGDTSAEMRMYFKNPTSGEYDLILTVTGMDKLESGYAGLIVDDNIMSHKHIKNFALNA